MQPLFSIECRRKPFLAGVLKTRREGLEIRFGRLPRRRKRQEASFRPSARPRSIRLRMNFARIAVLSVSARN